MMRITALDGGTEQMLTVDGKFAEPYIAELDPFTLFRPSVDARSRQDVFGGRKSH
jgi:hypothetical protein